MQAAPAVLGLRDRDWRYALDQQRRRKTRALKEQVRRSGSEARLLMHLSQTAGEVEQELAARRPAWWRAENRSARPPGSRRTGGSSAGQPTWQRAEGRSAYY
jgi:hypothetical protein